MIMVNMTLQLMTQGHNKIKTCFWSNLVGKSWNWHSQDSKCRYMYIYMDKKYQVVYCQLVSGIDDCDEDKGLRAGWHGGWSATRNSDIGETTLHHSTRTRNGTVGNMTPRGLFQDLFRCQKKMRSKSSTLSNSVSGLLNPGLKRKVRSHEQVNLVLKLGFSVPKGPFWKSLHLKQLFATRLRTNRMQGPYITQPTRQCWIDSP